MKKAVGKVVVSLLNSKIIEETDQITVLKIGADRKIESTLYEGSVGEMKAMDLLSVRANYVKFQEDDSIIILS